MESMTIINLQFILEKLKEDWNKPNADKKFLAHRTSQLLKLLAAEETEHKTPTMKIAN